MYPTAFLLLALFATTFAIAPTNTQDAIALLAPVPKMTCGTCRTDSPKNVSIHVVSLDKMEVIIEAPENSGSSDIINYRFEEFNEEFSVLTVPINDDLRLQTLTSNINSEMRGAVTPDREFVSGTAKASKKCTYILPNGHPCNRLHKIGEPVNIY